MNYSLHKLTQQTPRTRLQQVAEIHRQEITEGFLSSLGTGFLTQLYQSLVEDPHTFVIVAERSEEILGFICGTTSTGNVYQRFLRRQAWRIAPRLMWRMLSPRTAKRVAETLLYPRRTAAAQLPEAEILNFCVSGRFQRLGVGRRLFSGLNEEFSRRGVRQIRIVTGQDQQSAQQFYDAVGAVRATEFELHQGTQSLIYVYDVPQPERRAA